MGRDLFLARTPFHALLCRKIIERERVEDFDVLYVSKRHNAKDDHYYQRMAEGAGRATALKRLGNKSRLARDLPWWAARRRYDVVHVSTLNAWYFRAILGWHRRAEWRTFDDGAANYWRRRAEASLADRMIGAALGGAGPSNVVARALWHYAVRDDLPNVAPPAKVCALDMKGATTGEGSPVTLVIGQNHDEYLAPAVAARLRAWLIDCDGLYVPHPREVDPPASAVQTELIIEDLVAAQSGPVTLIGGFSTAFITAPAERKIYVDADGDAARRALMQRVGCEVVPLR